MLHAKHAIVLVCASIASAAPVSPRALSTTTTLLGCCQRSEQDNRCAPWEYLNGICIPLSGRSIGCTRNVWKSGKTLDSATGKCIAPPESAGRVEVKLYTGNMDCGSVPDLVPLSPVRTFAWHELALGSRNGIGTYNPNAHAINDPILFADGAQAWSSPGNFAASLTLNEWKITTAGTYLIQLHLGDADTARVLVDGNIVIDTGCTWGGTVEAHRPLGAGAHRVVLEYADDGWGDFAALSYAGPDTNGALVNVAFYEEDPPPPLPTPSTPPLGCCQRTETDSRCAPWEYLNGVCIPLSSRSIGCTRNVWKSDKTLDLATSTCIDPPPPLEPPAPAPIVVPGRPDPNARCNPADPRPTCSAAQNAIRDDWRRINCPVMGALVKNGDLLPDCDGFVSKRQVKDALLCVGISGRVAKATTDANFDHLDGDTEEARRLNLYAMSTVAEGDHEGESPPDGAVEHFRSTGIRDVGDKSGGTIQPDPTAFESLRLLAPPTGEGGKFWTLADALNGAALWDVDTKQVHPNGGRPSSDTNAMERPHECMASDTMSGNTTVLDATGRSVPNVAHKCFSALLGSIGFMFQEFGTPTGPGAALHAGGAMADGRCGDGDEFCRLFVSSDYPRAFEARRPKHCGGGEFGCASCLQDAEEGGGAQATHVFCRCMMMADFLASGEPDDFQPFSAHSALRADPDYKSRCERPTFDLASPAARRQLAASSSAARAPPCYPHCETDGVAAVGAYGHPSPVDVFVSGSPAYQSRTVGTYKATSRTHAGAPVYERNAGGYVWSLYRRRNGKWYLDFNEVSEEWSGTVGYARRPSRTPFAAQWNRNMAVGYARVEVVGRPAYWYYGSAGIFTPSPSLVHSGKPVYRRVARFSSRRRTYTWSLYQRSNGKWYLDHNDASDAWSGTVNYAHRPSTTPLLASWSKWRRGRYEMNVVLPPAAAETRRALEEANGGTGAVSADGGTGAAPSSVEETAIVPAAPPEQPVVIPSGLPEEIETVPDEDDGDAAEDDFQPGSHPQPHTAAAP